MLYGRDRHAGVAQPGCFVMDTLRQEACNAVNYKRGCKMTRRQEEKRCCSKIDIGSLPSPIAAEGFPSELIVMLGDDVSSERKKSNPEILLKYEKDPAVICVSDGRSIAGR
jgi:hypothetical protein